jgi:hypothetical protein
MFLFRPSDEIVQSIECETETPNLFSHNLHDLESLWRVAVWMVLYNHFSKVLKSDDEQPAKSTEFRRQLKLAQFYFPLVPNSGSRRDGFQTSFREACAELPSEKNVICPCLEDLRKLLIKHYKAVESTLPQSIDLNSSKDIIYDAFKTIFSSSKKHSADCALDTPQRSVSD